MKELRKTFTGIGEVRDFEFTQLIRSGRAYLYQVEIGNQIHYEVFKRRINTRHEEPNVSYPSSKGFGVWAKTTRDFQKAIQYLITYTISNG